jgi:hypothetical protein
MPEYENTFVKPSGISRTKYKGLSLAIFLFLQLVLKGESDGIPIQGH